MTTLGGRFGREALTYLAGFLIAGLAQFLAIPIYSRALGPEQYGYLTLTIAVTTALAGVMVLGGDVALARFWVDARDDRSRRSLATTWIAFLTAWSVLVAVLACILAPYLAAALGGSAQQVAFLVLGVAGVVPAQLSRMLAQILRNTFRPVPFALTTAGIAGLNTTFDIALGAILGLGVSGILVGVLVGEAIGAVVRLALVRGSLSRHLDVGPIPSLLRFGVPFVPASLATWVFTGVDRIVMEAHSSTAELGAYGLVTTLIGPFTVFTLAMGQAWVPRIVALHVAHEEVAARTTALAIHYSLAGLGAAALALGAVAPWLVTVVGGAAYASAAPALPFLALGAAFSGNSLFTSTGLTLVKRTAAIPLVTIAAASADVLLLLVAVPRWGAVGAAAATAGAFLLLTAAMYVFSNRAFPLRGGPRHLAIMSTMVAILVAQSLLATVSPGAPIVFFSLAMAVAALGLLARLATARST